jgi:uncharacterized membrane protein
MIMWSKLRKYFLSGLVVFLPIALTIYLFFLAINFTDNLFGEFFGKIGLSFVNLPGLSIVLGIYIIILIGFITTNFLGKKIHVFFERIVLKLPFFRQVYPALKEMAIFLFAHERISSFKQVILVEYPRKGVYVMGFLTNESSMELNKYVGKELMNVFIPSSPSPITGFTILVVKKEIIYTQISIENAFKFIVSGGVVNPHDRIDAKEGIRI